MIDIWIVCHPNRIEIYDNPTDKLLVTIDFKQTIIDFGASPHWSKIGEAWRITNIREKPVPVDLDQVSIEKEKK